MKVEVITLQEALKELRLNRPTLFKHVKLGNITPSYQDELRGRYTRRILYIAKDANYRDFKKVEKNFRNNDFSDNVKPSKILLDMWEGRYDNEWKSSSL